MARSSVIKLAILVPDPSRQLAFQELLVSARRTWLIDALREALEEVDAALLRRQLEVYVPDDVHVIMSKSGIPDEYVFPMPILLEVKPTLVAYYRLLLGLPQKTFYGTGKGMGIFKSMEQGSLTPRQKATLPAFCTAMSEALADLVRQMSPTITPRDVAELPILTLGQQFQGGNNNLIGKVATTGVFLAIESILAPFTVSKGERIIRVQTSTPKTFIITLAGDPDVRIQESRGSTLINKVAIEIKGGADRSNQHNRIGEAEKSHQKAVAEGYQDFWTIIHTKDLKLSVANIESPTTKTWFDTAQILSHEGPDWEAFEKHLLAAIEVTTL